MTIARSSKLETMKLALILNLRTQKYKLSFEKLSKHVLGIRIGGHFMIPGQDLHLTAVVI